MLHAATIRSPYAHAWIKSINVEAAPKLPGVVAVVTGAEAAELCNPMPDFGPAPDKHVWRCLAHEKVRYVGESVAAVVAESRYVAAAALDLIEVAYEHIPPVEDPQAALQQGSALVPDPLCSHLPYARTFTVCAVENGF